MKSDALCTAEVLEKFTFADGVRYAWVTYRIFRFSERQVVGVRRAE
jgi:hypothetical protein